MQSGRDSLCSPGGTGDIGAEDWHLDDFLNRADIRFAIDDVGRQRAASLAPGMTGLVPRIPASQRSLEERINLAASVMPVVLSTDDACQSLNEQADVIRSSIASLEENISDRSNGVPQIYAQLEQALRNGDEFTIQETLRDLKEACRCVSQ